jgi:hypothetical protein
VVDPKGNVTACSLLPKGWTGCEQIVDDQLAELLRMGVASGVVLELKTRRQLLMAVDKSVTGHPGDKTVQRAHRAYWSRLETQPSRGDSSLGG